MLAVVSSCVISPLTFTVKCSGLARSISSAVTSQGPMLPLASKFLPCVTLNLPWRIQSRMVPSLHSVTPATCSSAWLCAMRRPARPITSAISPS